MSGKLSAEQMALAGQIGKKRHAARGQTFIDVATDVNIACAEHAVSLALNRKWDGEFTGLAGWKIWKKLVLDVRGLQVRTTSFVLGSLTVAVDDPDDHVFVLVIDRDSPTFALVGWILGSEAKKPEYWNDRDSLIPSFHVPQSALLPCWDLRREPEGTKSERTRDPAADFGGKGRFPQRRTDDDGQPASAYGNVIRSKYALPCCRCQTFIAAGDLSGGNRVTGTIHGDSSQCRKQRKTG